MQNEANSGPGSASKKLRFEVAEAMLKLHEIPSSESVLSMEENVSHMKFAEKSCSVSMENRNMFVYTFIQFCQQTRNDKLQ